MTKPLERHRPHPPGSSGIPAVVSGCPSEPARVCRDIRVTRGSVPRNRSQAPWTAHAAALEPPPALSPTGIVYLASKTGLETYIRYPVDQPRLRPEPTRPDCRRCFSYARTNGSGTTSSASAPAPTEPPSARRSGHVAAPAGRGKSGDRRACRRAGSPCIPRSTTSTPLRPSCDRYAACGDVWKVNGGGYTLPNDYYGTNVSDEHKVKSSTPSGERFVEWHREGSPAVPTFPATGDLLPRATRQPCTLSAVR